MVIETASSGGSVAMPCYINHKRLMVIETMAAYLRGNRIVRYISFKQLMVIETDYDLAECLLAMELHQLQTADGH